MADPTAQTDQLGAAVTDARHRLATIATAGGRDVHRTADPTGWITRQAARFADALTGPRARLCPHISGSPGVVHAAVWAPGLVVCASCTHLLRPTRTEDATCDRCRRTVDRIHSGMAAVGPVLLAYGLCPPCQTTTRLTPTPPVEGGTHPRTAHPTARRADRRGRRR